MIAASTPTTITHTMDSEPCEASTEQAISAVSPGTGRPKDSRASEANSSAHRPLAVLRKEAGDRPRRRSRSARPAHVDRARQIDPTRVLTAILHLEVALNIRPSGHPRRVITAPRLAREGGRRGRGGVAAVHRRGGSALPRPLVDPALSASCCARVARARRGRSQHLPGVRLRPTALSGLRQGHGRLLPDDRLRVDAAELDQPIGVPGRQVSLLLPPGRRDGLRPAAGGPCC